MNDSRKEILQIVIVLVGIIFLIKLFSIQVLDKRYAEMAEGNAIMRQVEYPFRGLIYDRNNKLIVYNTPEYDIEVITKDIRKFDSVKFCNVFEISREELRKKFKEMKARREYSPFKPTLFIDQLSKELGFHPSDNASRTYYGVVVRGGYTILVAHVGLLHALLNVRPEARQDVRSLYLKDEIGIDL